MADTDKLKGYRNAAPPKIAGGEANYLQQELSKISSSIESIMSVLRLLEVRLEAGSL